MEPNEAADYYYPPSYIWREEASMSVRWSRPGPLCRIRLDLNRLPGGLDSDAARELLPTAPGVVRVEIPSHGHHALVLHDATTSVAQLWNWLRDQGTHPADTQRHVERER